MDQYEQIEQKYGLALPEAYRSMYEAGWCDVKGETYFWLFEAKWMSLIKILNYQPEDYHKPGFVPFARTAGGDNWCWWPSFNSDVVVSCPHDFELGRYYAPSFIGFIYRQLLEYGLYVPSEYEQEVRQNLREAVSRLSAYLPVAWRDTLETLAAALPVQHFAPNGRESGLGLMSEELYQVTIQRDLAFPLLDQEFQWMYPLTEDQQETAEIWREVVDADHTSPIEEKIAWVEAEKARRNDRE